MTNCPGCLEFDHVTVEVKPNGECPRCGNVLTCATCNVADCEFRNDGYNLNGDCLFDK